MKRAVYWIVVGGTNVSSAFAPYLERITVTDKVGTTSDTCTIAIDDKDCRVILPKTGDPLQVYLGWESDGGPTLVFDGTIDEVHALGDRGGGRRVEITAKGFDTKGKAKQHRKKHYDNKTVKAILEDAAKAAGITEVKCDPELGAIVLDYEAQRDESFIHFGSRIASDIGGQFKIVGKTAVLTKVGAGTSVSGQALPTIDAVWGDNLHEYSISPDLARHLHANSKADWYDPDEAKWKTETEPTGDEGATADQTDRHTHHSQSKAKNKASGKSKLAKKDKGGGYVKIEGNASCQPEATCNVLARPGIDGPYMIEQVMHVLDRNTGWTTQLQFKQPGKGTGKDTRK